MLRRRSRKQGEHGQVVVLFALSLVVVLAFAAIVVDIGMLRNDRQNLANAMDAGALAGGTLLPVSGQVPTPPATVNIDGTHNYLQAIALIQATVKTDYPGLTLPTIANGGIQFRCLIGALTNGTPDYSQITDGVCNPSNALGHVPSASFPNDFIGAGPTRSSICQPYNFTGPNGNKGDTCNIVLVSGAASQAYGFARVLGVNSGSTGTVQSAACNGPCGTNPVTPVDLVIILDRTGSMAENNGDTTGPKIQALQAAAKAVLGVYNPAIQRVALALTGPGKVDSNGNPTINNCGLGFGSGSAYGVGDDTNFTARASLTAGITRTATTLTVSAPDSVGFPKSGTFRIFINDGKDEQMDVTAGQGTNTWTVTRGVNGTTASTHSNNAEVDMVTPWVPDLTAGHNTVGMWVPVGLSGTDTTSPLPNPNGANGTYSTAGVVNNNSTIVKAINCIQAYSDGTNLTTPIQMAQKYLDTYGRKGVTQGIILETDGHPQVGFNGGNQFNTNDAYTCKSAIAAATAAKADKTNSPLGIQLFTVGYGVDNTSKCPIFTTNTNNDDGTYNMYEGTDATGFNWSGVSATTLLGKMATDSAHFFNNPPTSQLAAVFTQAAVLLSHSGLHLIQPYPAPIVTSVNPTSGAAASRPTITVTGEFFTGATKVQIGGVSVAFTVVSDTSITFTAPVGTKGTTVDIIVTTGGGSSPQTAADQYKYT